MSNIDPRNQTIAAESTSTKIAEILDRARIFDELWSALAVKPIGPALIYQVCDQMQVESLPLDAESIVVGRLPLELDAENGADVAFPNCPQLGRRHFCVLRIEDDFVLRDLESFNGTYVNAAHERTAEKRLVAGDIIYAGGIVFAFTGN